MPLPPTPPISIPPTTPVPPSQTIQLVKGQRLYVSTQGDWWDLIAIKVYGARRGNEHLMYRLLEANYPLRDISQFPAGVAIVVPAVQVETDIPLVPWKKATIIP
jgi:phage tail protein X